uniref:Uncharacterized protein n=1 Tax=Lactuca sativa TaxID=4236 RepID=A0A9R1VEW4_LACSA|nr:hypothetical protein LSAT_V11C500253580 [Lactuca sativa]
MHSHSSKKTIKLNSFYLDNTKNINLGTTSTNLASTPTTIKTSIYKDNIGFDKYVTSKLPDKRKYYVLSNDMTSKNASTISASSSSIKLNSGCHNLKRKTTHLSLIPLIDLTENVENIDQLINENLINIWIMVIKMLYVKHVMQSYGEMNPSEVKKKGTQIILYVVVTAKCNFQI